MQSNVAVHKGADGEVGMIVALLQDRSAVNGGNVLGGPLQVRLLEVGWQLEQPGHTLCGQLSNRPKCVQKGAKGAPLHSPASAAPA